MFTKTRHLESAFRHIRSFTLVIIVLSIGLCGFVFFKSYQLAAATQHKIYILVNGKAIEALAADRKENLIVEAKDHIALFHQYFFTLDPDDKVIHQNVSKAFYLADASAKRQYENLKENGYYSSLIAGNISQRINTDSISINTTVHPYYFRYYGTQEIIRATTIVYRSLITEGYLRNVNRSENNTHGFLIERWKTLINQDIKIVNR